MEVKFSKYQEALFNEIQNTNNNILVQASAGSGKSFSIEHASKLVKGSHVILAFNKSIAESLSSRGLNARTFHSITLSAVLKASRASLEPQKLRQLVKSNWDYPTQNKYAAFAMRLVSMAKNMGIGCLIDDTESAWYELVDHHDLQLDSEQQDTSISEAIMYSRQLLNLSNADVNRIDFDDALYLSVKDGIALPKFGMVFVDEAQDCNAIQLAVIKKMLNKDSRICAVGDRSQSLYGFRGSMPDAMDEIKNNFNCVELPLSITYRCSKKVVEFAKKWDPTIEAAEMAEEGKVVDLGDKYSHLDFKNTDLVVSRYNKPLVELCYWLIRNKVAANILGRDIGVNMINLIDKMKAKGIKQLETKLNSYRHREIEKAKVKEADHRIDAINDRVDSIIVLIDSLNENERTIPKLIALINSIFEEGKGKVTLATIHKAKGLEVGKGGTCWWINHKDKMRATRPWQKDQERCCQYVAATRAKTKLALITVGKEKKIED